MPDEPKLAPAQADACALMALQMLAGKRGWQIAHAPNPDIYFVHVGPDFFARDAVLARAVFRCLNEAGLLTPEQLREAGPEHQENRQEG